MKKLTILIMMSYALQCSLQTPQVINKTLTNTATAHPPTIHQGHDLQALIHWTHDDHPLKGHFDDQDSIINHLIEKVAPMINEKHKAQIAEYLTMIKKIQNNLQNVDTQKKIIETDHTKISTENQRLNKKITEYEEYIKNINLDVAEKKKLLEELITNGKLLVTQNTTLNNEVARYQDELNIQKKMFENSIQQKNERIDELEKNVTTLVVNTKNQQKRDSIQKRLYILYAMGFFLLTQIIRSCYNAYRYSH